MLDIEDIGTSKWSQVEALERVERGEEIRGREVIRTLVVEAGEGPTTGDNPSAAAAAVSAAAARSAGPYRYLLQDARGTRVVAFEKVRVPGLGLGLGDDNGGVSVGAKIVLKAGCVVRRGVVMLGPESVRVLGGRVEAWDRTWREGRKERLKRAVEGEREGEAEVDGPGG